MEELTSEILWRKYCRVFCFHSQAFKRTKGPRWKSVAVQSAPRKSLSWTATCNKFKCLHSPQRRSYFKAACMCACVCVCVRARDSLSCPNQIKINHEIKWNPTNTAHTNASAFVTVHLFCSELICFGSICLPFEFIHWALAAAWQQPIRAQSLSSH